MPLIGFPNATAILEVFWTLFQGPPVGGPRIYEQLDDSQRLAHAPTLRVRCGADGWRVFLARPSRTCRADDDIDWRQADRWRRRPFLRGCHSNRDWGPCRGDRET